MKKIMMIIMAVALVALPTMAQRFRTQEQPVFQSTSTLTPSGSVYSAQPALNADGTAYNPAAASAPSGPRKNPGVVVEEEPDDPIEESVVTGGQLQPVGDAVLPLMLMALAFGGVIYLRRRKALNR